MLMARRFVLLALVLIGVVVAACGADPTTIPTPASTATPSPTATAVPAATASPVPTAAPSPVPSAAPTRAPSVAPTLVPERPAQATATPPPTRRPDPTVSLFPLEIKDGTGETIIFDAPPQRIVSFSAANTEIMFALGLGDRVVGRDAFSDYPVEALDVPSVGNAFALNLELIVSLEPDLVFISFEGPKEQLREVGLRPLFIPPSDTLEGVLRYIRVMGQIMGRPGEAATLAAQIEREIQDIENLLRDVGPGPSVYYELDPGLWTVGPATFIGDMISIAKAQNVAAAAGGTYPQLSNEYLVAQDPEVILLADSSELGGQGDETPESVAARPGWSNITAVREGRIYPVNPSLLSRPGPRIGQGLRHLVELIHPELFP